MDSPVRAQRSAARPSALAPLRAGAVQRTCVALTGALTDLLCSALTAVAKMQRDKRAGRALGRAPPCATRLSRVARAAGACSRPRCALLGPTARMSLWPCDILGADSWRRRRGVGAREHRANKDDDDRRQHHDTRAQAPPTYICCSTRSDSVGHGSSEWPLELPARMLCLPTGRAASLASCTGLSGAGSRAPRCVCRRAL